MFKKRIMTAFTVANLMMLLTMGVCNGSAVHPKNEKTIGIIAALDYEVDTLKAQLKNMQTYELAGTKYYSGTIGKHKVVCMQCGMGKVSAALGAQIMITKFSPDVVINTGCAGAMVNDLMVGDMVLADSTVEWDLDTIAIGNPRGYVSAMDKVKMTADAKTTDEIAKVIGTDSKVYRGLVVSGDQFVSTKEQRKLILDAFPGALCAEMEGGAIGHVCEQNGVPFCVIRCMSDNANGDSGVDFAAFSQIAGEKSAKYLLAYLNAY